MLDFLKSRDGRQKLTAYVLFGTIIVVFIFWGFKTVDTGSAGYAAHVNNEIISVGEFQRELDRQTQFYSQMMGGKFDLPPERKASFNNMVLERLIGEKLIAQGAEKEGFRATNSEIRDEIIGIPAFSRDGQFQREAYQGYLNSMHMTPSQFEAGLRAAAAINTTRTILANVLKPSPAELQKEYLNQQTRMNLDFVEIDPNDKSHQSSVSSADVEEFLKSPDAEKKIEEEYKSNNKTYNEPEEIHVSHILIKADPKDAKAEAAALKKIQDIAQRAKKEDFGKLAASLSEDSGSKAKKGDLGFFSKGKMVPEFEAAAFKLKKGQISEPVKSPYGYHLIKMIDHKDAKNTKLTEAKNDIAKDFVRRKKSQEVSNELDKLLKDDPKNVDKFLSQHGLKWESTGPFDLSASNIPKIGPVEEVTQVAMSLSKDKPLPNKLVRFASKAYLVRFKDMAQTKKVATDEDLKKISQTLSQTRTGETLTDWEKILAGDASISKNPIIVGSGASNQSAPDADF